MVPVSFCANTPAENAPQKNASAAHSEIYFHKADFIPTPGDGFPQGSPFSAPKDTYDYFRFLSFTFFLPLLSSLYMEAGGRVVGQTIFENLVPNKTSDRLTGQEILVDPELVVRESTGIARETQTIESND